MTSPRYAFMELIGSLLTVLKQSICGEHSSPEPDGVGEIKARFSCMVLEAEAHS
jgi:hypothetical protein